MSNKPPEGLPQGVTTRAMALSPKTYDAENMTVEAVMTTENPARVWDWERYDVVNEVLLMDGLKNGNAGTQLPLLDSHNRDRAEDQIGSTVIKETVKGNLIGIRRFSRANPRAAVISGMISEGHLTDGSIGYMVDKAVWVEEGKTKKIKGRDFTGPMKVVTSWRLLEDSVTPIGADPDAKMRDMAEASATAKSNPVFGKEDGMESVRKTLVALGMKSDANDEEMAEFLQSRLEKPEPVDVDAISAKAKEEGKALELQRSTAIRELAVLAGDITLADKHLDSGASVEDARKAMVEEARKAGKFGGEPQAKPENTETVSALDAIDNDMFARSLNGAAMFS